MAMVIQAVENAQVLLSNIEENKFGPIDRDFKTKVKESLESNVDSDITDCVLISSANASRSIVMNKYFVTHKKYLAGYGASGDLNVQNQVNKTLAKKILLSTGNIVKCNIITRTSRSHAEDIKFEMKRLQDLGLGEVLNIKPVGGGKTVTTFLKRSTEKMTCEDISSFTDTLAKLGINLVEYETSMFSDENQSPNKKQKLTTQN